MKIALMKDKKSFALAGLSFTELKIIKDSCDAYGRQGSAKAKEIAASLEKQMEEISI